MLGIIRAKAEAALNWLFWTPAKEPTLRPAAAIEPPAPPAVLDPPPPLTITAPKPVCSVQGCERPRHARGFCRRHYAQARRRAA